MTLAANIISAGLQYGQIETVKAVPGVKDVILETCYSPAVVDRQEVADPNMATSSALRSAAPRRTLPGTPARVCALL